jgi:hypothetical protein
MPSGRAQRGKTVPLLERWRVWRCFERDGCGCALHMRREVLPTLSKAFLVTFAVIGKQKSSLLLCKSSFNLLHKRQK